MTEYCMCNVLSVFIDLCYLLLLLYIALYSVL